MPRFTSLTIGIVVVTLGVDAAVHGNVVPIRAHMRATGIVPLDVDSDNDEPSSLVESQSSSYLEGNSSSSTQGKTDVIICRGIGDLSSEQFKELGDIWQRYADEGVITATSPLLYRITDNGDFDAFPSKMSLEEKVKDHMNPTGKVLPHVWCDASCCDNCHLPGALTAAMKNKEKFFEQSIKAAKDHKWSGYVLDFEGTMPNSAETTAFFREWASKLAAHTGPQGKKLEMHLWTGSGADTNKLVDGTSALDSMIDMSMYRESSAKRPRYTPPTSVHSSSLAEVNVTNGTGICPYGFPPPPAHSLLERNVSTLNGTSFDGARLVAGASRRELTSHIHDWCDKTKSRCGVGLITYDLSNKALGCQDILAVGDQGVADKVRTVWIWSGGIMPAAWESGFKRLTSGSERGDSSCGAHELPEAALVSTAGCAFDGNYDCKGNKRRH